MNMLLQDKLRKILVPLLIIGCSLIFALPVKAADFTINTACGIDGYATYEKPVQIAVTVKCNEDFTGMLRVIPSMDFDQQTVAYAEEISLAQNEEKTFYLTVASMGNLGKFDVQLLDGKDNIVYSEMGQVTLTNVGANVMLGILSEDYSALNYFDGAPISFFNYQGVFNTLELTKDNFPDSYDALSVLNYIIIDNYDTANLSDRQYMALKEWVKNGGILILSLGPNYQNVLHIFTDDFVSGTLGSLSKKTLSWTELGDLKNVDCLSFELDGGEAIDSFIIPGNAYKKKCGKGAVMALSYSLGMEPMTGWSMRKDAAGLLMMAAACESTEENISNGNSSYYGYGRTGTEIAKLINGSRAPSALLFGFVLLIYVILVGPVLYLVLKKKEIREKIWIAIPATALIFTGVIYLTGSIYKVRKPMLDTFTVVELDGNTKKEKAYVNVTCPKAKKYNILLDESFSDIGYDRNYYHYSVFGASNSNKDFDYMLCKKNGGRELVINNDTAFDTTNFTAGRLSDNDMGNIDFDIHFYTTGFDGTVTNNTIYDLKGVVVSFDGATGLCCQVGDIRQGETVAIDPSKVSRMTAYNFFDDLYNQNGSIYDQGKDKFSQYKMDDFVENQYIRNTSYNNGFVWGKIDSYTSEITSDESVKKSGIALIIREFYAKYEDVDGTYCPDINSLVMTGATDFDRYSGMIWSEGEFDITYSFEQYKGINELKNTTYMQTPPADVNGKYADVYAYNVDTGQYEQIFTYSDTINGAELRKYLVGNVLMLRYVTNNGNTYGANYMPTISARGDE